jgi:hypothetical protein
MDFLTQSSKAVFSSMQAADPQAIWLMQGWLFMNDARFWQEPQLIAYLDVCPPTPSHRPQGVVPHSSAARDSDLPESAFLCSSGEERSR